MTARLAPGLPWLVLVLWLVVWVPTFLGMMGEGRVPIDFLAYRRAAEALGRGESPYPPPERARQIWRGFHRAEAELLEASAGGRGPEAFRALLARPQQPGPYLYPPTLALLVAQLHLTAPAFAALTGPAIFGFAWLWLRGAAASGAWVLLVVGSWDVLASWSGGNAELLLLFATLLAARLLWGRRALAAAPLIALVVLVKPFYALFFAAFGLLWLVGADADVRARLRSLALAVAAGLALVAAEAARWGAPLRAEALAYLRHAVDYHWFALPVAEQTPMSAWNRTPFQVLVGAGLPAVAAQWATLGPWLLLVALTLWRVRASRARLAFPPAFALALVLLHGGRPVGWGLPYLDLVVLVAAWPSLRGWPRAASLAAALALAASHWWALALTVQGRGLPLLTLQAADRPWETCLVLPLSWLLLLRAASLGSRRVDPGAGRAGGAPAGAT